MAKSNLYHYTECGLDYIYLENGFTLEDDPDYGELISFNDGDGLDRAIGKLLIRMTSDLSGMEVYFLRVMMDIGEVELEGVIGAPPKTIEGWEMDGVAVTPYWSTLVKLAYANSRKEYSVMDQLLGGERDERGKERPGQLHLATVGGTWHSAQWQTAWHN